MLTIIKQKKAGVVLMNCRIMITNMDISQIIYWGGACSSYPLELMLTYPPDEVATCPCTVDRDRCTLMLGIFVLTYVV